MSDDVPPRRRRVPVRWVTLAEAVAIAAVAISGLGLYNGWNNRNEGPAPSGGAATGQPLVLKAAVEQEGARLKLAPVAASQVVQSQTIAFPATLGVAPVETTGDPRIEAGWFDKPLRRASGDAGKAVGDRRLPVLVTTRYLDGTTPRSDGAIYQVGYAIEEGGLFGGGHVRLSGLSLLARHATDAKRLDTLWTPKSR